MWHEARKQERKIRGMMVDYKKRSERRRLYYHRIKADPTQFLRLQGASCKIFVEEEATEIEIAASALMPWQGQRSNMIDRFDVRANLDIIPEPENNLISSDLGENAVVDQKCQYERWRTLATNDLVGLGEDECLTQIAEDESAVLTKVTKKSASSSGAKIGFSYESNNAESESESEDSEADSKEFLPTDPDLDITFDVRELDAENKSKLNEIAAESYAIPDFTRLHIEDKVESEMREFEIREEQNRAERVAKLSKTERRKEKEERRKSKDVPPHMRVDDPYRNPHLRRSSSRRKDETDSSSDEEKTVQNIEISSARSNTYKNVKSVQKPVKKSLPVFLQPKTTSTVLSNLVAARKQLLSKNNEAFDFGVGPSAPVPVEASNASPESKPVVNSRSRSRSPNKSRSRRSRSGNGYSRSSSRSRSRSRGRSRSRSRSRTRSRGRSRSRSRGRKYSSTSSRQRSRSRTKSGRGMSPRRKLSPVKDSRPKSPDNRPKVNDMPLKKADSLKALKPHERLKLKLQSQLKKRQRDEKRKEQAQIEAKEQEAFERAEELRVLKRQMWEKEEEEYWKKREEEEKEYQKKKAEEKALKADDSSSNGEKPLSRSRSGSRRRHRSRSKSREKSAENHGSKRSKSTSSIQIDKKSTESAQKISLVPEYERADGEEASSRQSSRSRRDEVKDRSRTDDKRKRTEPADKQRSEEGRRRNRNEGDRRRGDAERKTPGENRASDRSRYQGGGERGDRTRQGEGRRRDDERGRHPEERTRYPEEPPRGRDRGSHRSLHR